MSNKDDLEKLKGFVQDLERNLEVLVNETAEKMLPAGCSKEDVAELKLMKKSYQETIPHFKKMLEYLETHPEEATEKLASLGLTGASLDFKLGMVNSAEKEMRKDEKRFKDKLSSSNDKVQQKETKSEKGTRCNVVGIDFGEAFADYQNIVDGKQGTSIERCTPGKKVPVKSMDKFCDELFGACESEE